MKEVWLKDEIPLAPAERQTYRESLQSVLDGGWATENSEAIVTATAILRAECAGDPTCFLAYLEIERRTQSGIEYVKRKLRKIPGNLTMAEFKKALEPYPNVKLIAADRGLFQISSYWHNTVTNKQAFDPKYNAAYAYQHLYVGWDRKFSAWAAYTNGRYKYYVPYVKTAFQAYLRELDLDHWPEAGLETYTAQTDQLRGPTQSGPARTGPYVRWDGHNYYRKDKRKFRTALANKGISWWYWLKQHPYKARTVFGIKKEG